MPVNGSEWVDNPWNVTFSPFTNVFENTIGNGNVFYLVPVIAFTIGLLIKTRDTMVTTVFMLCSGALLAGGSIFNGAADMAILFTIFAAIGFVGMIASIIFQR